MARKKDLAGKLQGQESTTPNRPGWRETITAGQAPLPPINEEEPANKLKRKTYLIRAGMIDHIEDLAQQERVGINELVRFLLSAAIDQVEDGTLVIPTKPGKRRITN